MKINLVMPMAGAGSRFRQGGYEVPKPLIELDGKPFFWHSAMSCLECFSPETISFVVLKEHVEGYSIDKRIREYFPEARIVVLEKVLKGAVLSCLAGLKGGEGQKALDPETPVLFNDCDHSFRSEAFKGFASQPEGAELPGGALLSFESSEPKFSFAKVDEGGYVLETREKVPISTHAICGAYWFKSPKLFEQYAAAYLENCSYSEYYLSGVYNEMIKDGCSVKLIPLDSHTSFGTPEELGILRK